MAIDAGTGFISILPDTSKFAATLQKQVAPALDRVGQGLNRAGRSLTRSVSLPLIGIGAVATKLAADFDQQMRNVNSIMRVSGAELDRFGLQVRELSTRVPEDASSLAEGLYNVASSGFAGAKAMNVLEVSAKAASAGMTDTETSSRAVIAVLNAYGLGAKEAARVSDVLFQGVNVGIETFEELAGSIGTYIGAASQLKVPLEDVVGAQAAMTKTGINAAEAATALNGIFKTLLKPSVALGKELKGLGFESGQAALESLGLQGVIEKLSDGVGENKGRWVELFPEVRAARGAMALAADDGQLLDDVMRSMTDSTGAAGAAFEEQSKGAAFKFQIALNKLKDAGIELGNELVPIITRDVIPVVRSLVDGFKGLSDEQKGQIIKWGAVAIAAGPFLRIMGGIVSISSSVIGALGRIAGAFAGSAGVAAAAGGATTAAAGTSTALLGIGAAPVLAALGLAAGSVLAIKIAADRADERINAVVDDIKRGVKSIPELEREIAAHEAGPPPGQKPPVPSSVGRGQFVGVAAEQAAADRGREAIKRYREAISKLLRPLELTVRNQKFLNDVIDSASGLTEKQIGKLGRNVSALELLGGGLSKSERMFVDNLIAAGDFGGAMDVVRGKLDRLTERLQKRHELRLSTESAQTSLERFLASASRRHVTIGVRLSGPGSDFVLHGGGQGGAGGEHGAFIPGAQHGGFVRQEQFIRVGERGKDEAIVPLEDERGLRALSTALERADTGGHIDEDRLGRIMARAVVEGLRGAEFRFDGDGVARIVTRNQGRRRALVGS